MEEVLQNLTSNEDMLTVVIVFGVGGIIAIVSIVFNSLKSISINNEHEASRREIAAYVAEGSMTPEDGERLLKASPKRRCS